MPIKADAQHARWSFNEAHCNWGGALGAVRPRAKAIVAIMAGSCTCPQLRGGAMSRNLHEHLEVSDPAPIRLALEHPVVLVKVEEPLGEVGVDALPQLAQSLPGVYLEEDARARYARTGLCLWRGGWTLVHTSCLSWCTPFPCHLAAAPRDR